MLAGPRRAAQGSTSLAAMTKGPSTSVHVRLDALSLSHSGRRRSCGAIRQVTVSALPLDANYWRIRRLADSGSYTACSARVSTATPGRYPGRGPRSTSRPRRSMPRRDHRHDHCAAGRYIATQAQPGHRHTSWCRDRQRSGAPLIVHLCRTLPGARDGGRRRAAGSGPGHMLQGYDRDVLARLDETEGSAQRG